VEQTENDLNPENTQRTFAQFCSFLFEKKDANCAHYKPGTQVQYLSNVKSFLAKKFRTIAAFKELQWYEELAAA